MLNDFHSPDGHAEGNRDSVKRESNGAPLSDREVPLNSHRTPAVVHAWLDGEVSMSDALRADTSRDVEFWNQINEQAEARRHMRTPVHVQQRIMEALPRSAPTTETGGWLQRNTQLSNGMLIMVGAALVGIGILAAFVLR